MDSPGEASARHGSSFAFSHELFGRALGGVTLLAWLSLHSQLDTLFGPRGILPMQERLEALAAQNLGAWLTPSLLHLLGGSSLAMHALCAAGELASLAMIFGLASGPAALLCYGLYLSFVSLGWPFLPLQWDTLLLEALILAALLGRWRHLRPAKLAEPSTIARFAGFALVTRLVFASGLVKVLSGDPTWRDGSALAYHHWTQPLPSPLAPFLHALPPSVHGLETYTTLTLELGGPLLVFAGWRGRRAFAGLVTALMALIALSGSYGFFNMLTVVLCIPLLDDDALACILPSTLMRRPRVHANVHPDNTSRARRALLVAYLAWAALAFSSSLGLPMPTPLASLHRWHVAGQYGLFARMTTDRHELLFEASEDGISWEPYEPWYKPGNPARAPIFCAPHMPRFDWMLWFAALGDGEAVDPWIVRVAQGLLENRAETRALFRTLPLSGRAPVAVRLVRARYRFGDETPWEVDERSVLRTWRRR